MDRLPLKVKVIITLTVAAAVAGGILSYGAFPVRRSVYDVLFFVVLAVACESLTINLPNQISVSVVFALLVSVIMLFSPFSAGIINAIATMFSFYKRDGKYYHILNTPFYKTVFNGANLFLAAICGSIVYNSLGAYSHEIMITKAILPIIVGVFVYLFINTSLVTLLISSLILKSPTEIWVNNTKWVIQNFLIMSPLGVILALAFQNYGYLGVLLFFGPLLMARYSFKLYMDLRRSYLETVQALSKALEAKDPVTSGHAERVGEYAVAIAREMRLSENRIDRIRYAALLHDIGKIGIADGVLKKPGGLSGEEFAQIREHPVIGWEILKDIDFLREASRIIRHHHERYDGKGYPDGLKGDQIPIEAYILAVADAFDAMTNDRPYRKALTTGRAREIIADEAGRQFHPKVADAFIKILDKGLLNSAY